MRLTLHRIERMFARTFIACANSMPSSYRLFAAIFALSLVAPALSYAQTTERHYIIALDDSGSMGNERFPAGRPGNDPYRLSRFATRALLALLPDDALATVISLGNNGLNSAQGVSEAPIPPLSRLRKSGERGNRDALAALLLAPKDEQARGALTKHDLSSTPCQRALDGIREALNRAWRPGAVQTAFLLSDGRCTDRIRVDAFLNELESERAAREAEKQGASGPRPFQFYFVCMGNETCSPELGALASRTGGAAFRASSAAHQPQPAELIDIFGQVIGRSQGVCPIVYDSRARNARLQRFPGSTGAQLLAVSEANESVALSPPRGVPLLAAHEGEHHWDDHVFRFAAGLLPPLRDAIDLPLKSSGAARLLAIPRYDSFQMVMRLLEGSCEAYQRDFFADAPEYRPGAALPAGSTLCVELALLGRDDQPIAREGMGRAISAALDLNRPGSSAPESISVLADRDTPIERFLYEIPNLAPGTLSLEGRVELSPECLDRDIVSPVGGEPTIIRAPRRSHEVSRIEFAVSSIADDHATHSLKPGGASIVTPALRFEGNFEPGTKVSVQRRDERPDEGHPHRCVDLYYGDERVPFANEAPLEISANVGSGRSLALRARSHCGFREDSSVRDVPVSFTLGRGGAESLLITRYQLHNQLDLTRELALTLKAAGNHMDAPWGPESESGGASQRYLARLDYVNASFPIPKELEVGFVLPEVAAAPRGDEAELHQEMEFTVRPGDAGPPLLIRAKARRCCEAEALRIPIMLTPLDTEGAAGEPLSSILALSVERDGFWSCYGPPIMNAIYTLIALFILWMIYNFFTKIHLLPTSSDFRVELLKSKSPRSNTPAYYEWNTIAYQNLHSRFKNRFLRRLRIAITHPLSILALGDRGYETVSYRLVPTTFIVQGNVRFETDLSRRSDFIQATSDDDKAAAKKKRRRRKRRAASGLYLRATGGKRTLNAYAVRAGQSHFYVFRDRTDNANELTRTLEREAREAKRHTSADDQKNTNSVSYSSDHRSIQLDPSYQIISKDYQSLMRDDFIGARVHS